MPKSSKRKRPVTVSTFTAGIVSDLHCHSTLDGSPKESFLLVGMPRKPANSHPVVSLMNICKTRPLRADTLLCPGDVANRGSQEGMSQGFAYLCDLKRSLKSKRLLCTVGNHDIDIAKKYGPSPFSLARNIHESFPLAKNHQSQFWADGYSTIEIKNKALIIILNSAMDHTDADSAKRGTFSDERLEGLDNHLSTFSTRSDLPTRIAVLHHHPLLHSFSRFKSTDVLSNGDQLLNILGKHQIDILVHGHRHQPRITRFSASGRSIIVIASGAFSAFLSEIGTVTRNLFHLLSIQKEKPDSPMSATLETWEYNHSFGWSPSTLKSAGLPHIISFQSFYTPVSTTDIATLLRIHNAQSLSSEEIFKRFPAMQFWLPDEMKAFAEDLKQNCNLRCIFDSETGNLHEIGITKGKRR